MESELIRVAGKTRRTMNMLRQIAANTLLNSEPAKIVAGVSVGLVGCYVPFASAFYLCRMANLSAASVSDFASVIAGAGLAACVMGIIAVYDSRRSLKLVAGIAALMMMLIGVLVSLTV
jgi:hypothetical protein